MKKLFYLLLIVLSFQLTSLTNIAIAEPQTVLLKCGNSGDYNPDYYRCCNNQYTCYINRVCCDLGNVGNGCCDINTCANLQSTTACKRCCNTYFSSDQECLDNCPGIDEANGLAKPPG